MVRVNKHLMMHFREVFRTSEPARQRINFTTGVKGKETEEIFIASKDGTKTLCALGVHVSFVANGTATVVSGAVPTDVIARINGRGDKLLKVNMNERYSFRRACEKWADQAWDNDTLAVNPSSVTYEGLMIFPLSGRNVQNYSFRFAFDDYSALYSADIIANPDIEIFGYYNERQMPELSILSEATDMPSVSEYKVKLEGDFQEGFLDYVEIVSDGTLVWTHVLLEDSDSVSGLKRVEADLLRKTEQFRYRNSSISVGSDENSFPVTTVKEWTREDNLKLQVSTAGTVYGTYFFKNETTEEMPTSEAQETPQESDLERDEPDSRNRRAKGQPNAKGGSGRGRGLR